VKACPAIVSDPFRAFDGLDATVKSTEPFPLPLDPDVTVIQGSLLTEVHVQPLAVATATVGPIPPAAPTE
jgi:hypothetical protein